MISSAEAPLIRDSMPRFMKSSVSSAALSSSASNPSFRTVSANDLNCWIVAIGSGSLNRKHLRTTLKVPKQVPSGKLINVAAIAPPKTIIPEGMSMKGPSPPPPIAIEARIKPAPRISPMIVAISMVA